MAGTHPFLTKLRGVLKTLDDEALAALANKGLLRRAQKDLESSRPTIIAAEETRLQLQVAEATVEIPELPAKSKCNCPATGVCRHILTALLYLRDDPELAASDAPVQGTLFTADGAESPSPVAGEAASAPNAAEILGNLSDEELQKWAGKALLKKAQKSLAANPLVEIATAGALVIRFPTRNITCRWIPSGGLLGMVCSCQAETICEHVVTAVLAFQASLGKRQVVSEQAVLEESAGAPRTRAEVLESVGVVLRELVSLGLSRLSAATAKRLTTLAVSAHGVDLPRLERMLKALADEAELSLRRDAQSSAANLLMHAAKLEALRLALQRQAAPALVGQHRSQYFDVGQLTLIGLGAQRWRSKTGYHGVTVYFWDVSRKGWATWSESRPVNQPGFDPVSRFRADGPWAGCNSPLEASRSVLKVSGAWRNPQGRLSGRSSIRALVTGPSKPLEVPDIIKKWSLLAEKGRQLFGGGFSDRTENQEIVLLSPRTWGPAVYDSLRQELVRPVVDEAGHVLQLWIPYTPEQQEAVELLEQHAPGEGSTVLGAIRLVNSTICVQPFTLHTADKVIHLNLEKLPPIPGILTAKKLAADEETLDDPSSESGDEEPPQTTTASPLGRLLVTAEAELEAIAEGGIAVRRNWEVLSGACQRLEALGLSVCSRPLSRLVTSLSIPAKLAETEHRNEAAQSLLIAYYVLRLAADQETVALACAGL